MRFLIFICMFLVSCSKHQRLWYSQNTLYAEVGDRFTLIESFDTLEYYSLFDDSTFDGIKIKYKNLKFEKTNFLTLKYNIGSYSILIKDCPLKIDDPFGINYLISNENDDVKNFDTLRVFDYTLGTPLDEGSIYYDSLIDDDKSIYSDILFVKKENYILRLNKYMNILSRIVVNSSDSLIIEDLKNDIIEDKIFQDNTFYMNVYGNHNGVYGLEITSEHLFSAIKHIEFFAAPAGLR